MIADNNSAQPSIKVAGSSKKFWRGGMFTSSHRSAGLRKDIEFNVNKTPRRGSKDTTNSSPVDPAYDPTTNTLQTLSIMDPKGKLSTKTHSDSFEMSKTSSIELPPIAVTGPDEQPQSFFDPDSSSDDDSPAIQRASSVRVAKPQIVEHTNTLKGKVPKIYTEGLAPPNHGQNMSKASTLIGEPLQNLYELTPVSSNTDSNAGQGPAEALKALEARSTFNHDTNDMMAEAGGPQAALKALEAYDQSVEASRNVTTMPNKYTSAARPEIPFSLSSVIESPEDSHASYMTNTTAFNPTNGLRLNPLSSTDRVYVSRAVSAPLPHRNPNRKVKIRPTDLITPHSDQEHSAFHEAVVSTPYPKNGFSISSIEEELKEKERLGPNRPLINDQLLQSKDRFPSPTRMEVLYLVLALAHHRGPTATIEIEIPHHDMSYRAVSISSSESQPSQQPFDDEDLFLTIRHGYYKTFFRRLLSFISARVLSYVTTPNPQALFDEVDFVHHLHNPSLGKNRKSWILWLRNTQELRISTTLPKRGSAISYPDMKAIDESCALPRSTSPASSPNSTYSRYSFARSPTYSPRLARPLFMPTNSKPTALPSVLELHYRFSLPKIALFTTAILLLSALSTTLWVLFGFPGYAAGRSQYEMDISHKYLLPGGSVAKYQWRRDAEERVLTGLVLGVLTLMLGGIVEGCWIWASWMLL